MNPEDLKTPQAFRTWITQKMEHLYENKEIPNDHLLIYLDYVERVVSESGEIDNPFWLKLVRQLRSNLKTLKRVE
jgi:hypothetical protein